MHHIYIYTHTQNNIHLMIHDLTYKSHVKYKMCGPPPELEASVPPLGKNSWDSRTKEFISPSRSIPTILRIISKTLVEGAYWFVVVEVRGGWSVVLVEVRGGWYVVLMEVGGGIWFVIIFEVKDGGGGAGWFVVLEVEGGGGAAGWSAPEVGGGRGGGGGGGWSHLWGEARGREPGCW